MVWFGFAAVLVNSAIGDKKKDDRTVHSPHEVRVSENNGKFSFEEEVPAEFQSHMIYHLFQI